MTIIFFARHSVPLEFHDCPIGTDAPAHVHRFLKFHSQKVVHSGIQVNLAGYFTKRHLGFEYRSIFIA
jgi:hypothetical protein